MVDVRTNTKVSVALGATKAKEEGEHVKTNQSMPARFVHAERKVCLPGQKY